MVEQEEAMVDQEEVWEMVGVDFGHDDHVVQEEVQLG